MGSERIATSPSGGRLPILYVAPWVDIGGTDRSTVDWFRFLDRDRFRPSLITTQPSPNRRLHELVPYAEEVWDLPQLMRGDEFPAFILAFIHTRAIRVVHIMNSNLAFELLPDIAALPTPPAVVVQLHVEEPGASGYVRYVTTRFANLVGAFSLTTHALSRRLEELEVPAAKRRVIPIGVDADGQFNPDRVGPLRDLDPEPFRILFPARLVEQKDPLLMVRVAEELRDRGLRFQLHVLGEGDLTDATRAAIDAAGLHREVILHGDCLDVAPWYASCQAVLLTSRYEGLPAVAYEAMAMGLPIVAPDLPGMDELIAPDSGVLIAPRDDPSLYANTLAALAGDEARRTRMGERGRELARRLSLERMAAEHASVYEELIGGAAGARARLAGPEVPPFSPAPVRLRNRQPGSTPLVSLIVPCFNHGRYLPECLASIDAQTYPSTEVVVVDDGSTDPETLSLLESLEASDRVTVVRQPANTGPSAARNAGIERARGRYILPVDADDVLVPTAVSALVEQLSAAPEDVGFVYPNLQHFGNRTDYEEMPSYNLHALLMANSCDAGSLLDREVFDAALRYPEDVVLGHEDWDFVLTLAEHGIHGEPATAKTLLCRHRGFTRNDLIEVSTRFEKALPDRHPSLYARRAAIKGEWNPALSVIALDGAGDEQALTAAARAQTCADFELVIRSDASRARALADGLAASRGRYVLASYGSVADLLANRTLVEKLLRILVSNPAVSALALAESDEGAPLLRLLELEPERSTPLRALCWTATGPGAPPAGHALPAARPLEPLARWLGVAGTVQWREVPATGAHDGAGEPRAGDPGSAVSLGQPRIARRADAGFRQVAPELPNCPSGARTRAEGFGAWTSPQVRSLCRHLDPGSGRYLHTNSPASPAGFVLEHVVGCLRAYQLAGTTSVRNGSGGGFEVGAAVDDLRDPGLLGFAECQPLPLFDELYSGRHPVTGQQVLAAGVDDPLAPILEHTAHVGFVLPHPLRPRSPAEPDGELDYGLAGLLRSVDLGDRRHRYRVGERPPGLAAGELGAVFTEPTGDCEPLWIDGRGRVLAAVLAEGRPALREAIRWIGDPFTWDRPGRPGPKLRASARRAFDSVALLASPAPGAAPRGTPAGYLLRSPESWTLPLHAGLHPVTGDQLLSTDPAEIEGLGYRYAALLGHVVARAPHTGVLGPIRPPAPWAARFGLVAVAEPTRRGA